MEYTESSISGTISKLDAEERSMFRASMDDAAGRLADGIKPESISSERIEKGNILLDTYEVLSEAVHGGMGSVWCVHHKNWDTDLAMKRPQPKYFAEGSRERKEEFVRECENWIELGLHPNIVSCYYVRDISGVPSIFSEWMDNGSLKDRIADGTLYEGSAEEVQERILDIAIQAARGLQYSHANGLIHQDIKPGNILLTKEWDAKVADFGLAKAAAQLTEGSDAGKTVSYTLAYCPKEQTEGAEPAEWMDWYAWALTVLSMYAGESHTGDDRLWKTGAEVKDHFDEYPAQCEWEIPETVLDLLRACIAADEEECIYDPSDAADILLEAYEEETGEKYPRPVPKAAEESAASLNNKGLSFMDLGQYELADDLWYQSMSTEEYYPEAVYNQKLGEWLQGTGTDIDLLEAVEKISDEDRMRDLHLMAQQVRGEESASGHYEMYIDLAKQSDIHYSRRKGSDLKLDGSEAVFSAVKDRYFVFTKVQEKKNKSCCIYVLDWKDNEDTYRKHADHPDFKYEAVSACSESACMDGKGLVLYSYERIMMVSTDEPAVLYEYPDGKYKVLTACGGENNESFWFSDGNSVYRAGLNIPEPGLFMKTEFKVWSLKLRQDGNVLLISDGISMILAADAKSGEKLLSLKPERLFDWYDLSEDGKCIYTGRKNELFCYDLENAEGTEIFEFPDSVTEILDKSGDKVLVKGKHFISIWDIANRICLRSIRREKIGNGYFLPRDNRKEDMIKGIFFILSAQPALSVFEIPDCLPQPKWALVKVTETAEQIEEDENFRSLIEQAEKAIDDGEYTSARDLLEEARRIPGRKNAEECQEIYDRLYPHFKRGNLTECIFRTDYSFAYKNYLPVFSSDGKYLIGRTGTRRVEVRASELLEDKDVDPVLTIRNCMFDDHFVPVCGGRRLVCIEAVKKFVLYDIPSGKALMEAERPFKNPRIAVINKDGEDIVIVHEKGMFGEKIMLAVNAETAEAADEKTAKSLLKGKSEYAGTNGEGISYRMEKINNDDHLCFYDKKGKKIGDIRVNCYKKDITVEYDHGVLQPHDLIIYAEGSRMQIASVWDFPYPNGQELPVPAPYGPARMSENCRYLYTRGNVYRLEWELLDEQEK
ncbi:MAG: serine/threonine protein kinase [Solobacterium sp.]|nr:serine/threonine protein kinase [Solobacterium sp.]